VALFRLDATQQEALQFLMDGLTDHQPAWIAAMQLGEIGPGARDAVPALIAALDAATNAMVFAQIPRALKAIGVPVESFLPRMTAQLNSISNDENTRVTMAARVLEIDPSNHEAHLVLMESIKKRSGANALAIDALGRAGPAAKEALPALREATTDPYGSTRESALRAIKEIEATPNVGK
jgi:HEAT repeat protein